MKTVTYASILLILIPFSISCNLIEPPCGDHCDDPVVWENGHQPLNQDRWEHEGEGPYGTAEQGNGTSPGRGPAKPEPDERSPENDEN